MLQYGPPLPSSLYMCIFHFRRSAIQVQKKWCYFLKCPLTYEEYPVAFLLMIIGTFVKIIV